MAAWMVVAVATAVAVGLLAAPVDAQDVDEGRDRRARQHFLSASAYFETGDYEAALREFQAAYRDSGRAGILYNVSLCHERLGNLPEAIDALARFLDSGEEVPNRSALEQRLARMRERQARVDAGDGSGGDRGPIESGAAVTPADAAGSGAPLLAIVGFSIAAVGLVGLAVGSAITLGEDARLRDACAPDCNDDEVSTIRTSRLIADISGGVSLAGAVLGLIGVLTYEGSF